jgi:hypothetical protein
MVRWVALTRLAQVSAMFGSRSLGPKWILEQGGALIAPFLALRLFPFRSFA